MPPLRSVFRTSVVLALVAGLSGATGVGAATDRWQPYPPGVGGPWGGEVRRLVAPEPSVGVLWAATGAGVFQSTDGGGTWQSRSQGFTSLDVTDVDVCRADPRVLVAATAGGGLHLSSDGGVSWSALPAASTGGVSDFYRVAVDPLDCTHFFAGTFEASFALYESVDSGASWADRGGYAVTRLRFAPAYPGEAWALFLSTRDGKVFRLLPGDTWPLWLGTPGDGSEIVEMVLPEDDGGVIVLANGGAGLIVSEDGGASWQTRFAPGSTLHIDAVAADPLDTRRLLFHLDDLYDPTQSALYESPDLGVTTTTLLLPESEMEVSGLYATDPHEWVAERKAGLFRRSARTGGFAHASTGLSAYTPRDVGFGSTVADLAVAGGDRNGMLGVGGMYVWDDASGGWLRRAAGLPPKTSMLLRWVGTDLWLGVEGHGLYTSPDLGLTWQARSGGLPDSAQNRMSDLAFAVGDPLTAVLGTASGVYYTTDGGLRWSVDGDYGRASGTLAWPDGQSKSRTFPITVVDDPAVEGDEIVDLTFSNPMGTTLTGGGTLPVTLYDNDGAPSAGLLRFTSDAMVVNEADRSFNVAVTRTGGTSGYASVTVTVAGGTAQEGVDFNATPELLEWFDGEGGVRRTVTLVMGLQETAGFEVVEGPETFQVALTGPVGATVAGSGTATVTLADDDGTGPGTLLVGGATYAAGEADGALTVTVTRSGGNAGAVSVDYATSDNTAVDPLPGAADWRVDPDPSQPYGFVAGGKDVTGNDGRLFTTLDPQVDWVEPAPGAFAGMQLFSLSVDPDAAVHLLAGTRASGLFESADGGSTWQAAADGTNGLPTSGKVDLTAMAAGGGGLLYAVRLGRDVYLTVDGGTTWSRPTAGIVPDSSGFLPLIYSLAFEPAAGRLVAGLQNRGLWYLDLVPHADVTPPRIDLTGPNPYRIAAASSYTDPGATAIDDVDGDLGPVPADTSGVVASVAGVYTVGFDVQDAAGNGAATVYRHVIVSPDTVPPVVTAPPPVAAEATGPTTPVELGTATATDNLDGVVPVDNDAPTGFPVGTTTVTWAAVDTAGNQGTATQGVTVGDTTPPTLTLLGPATLSHEAGTSFSDPGAAAVDLVDGDRTANVVIGGDTVDPWVLGAYGLTYDVRDTRFNAAPTVTRTVIVADTTPPVITLVGADPFPVEAGEAYVEPGATATDTFDSNLPAVTLGGDTVDPNTVGTYTVTYDVVDAEGNAAIRVNRTVSVADTRAPVITLVGANPLEVPVGGAYTEPGATATDTFDPNLPAVTIGGATVAPDTVGTYWVTYDVTDASGNAATQATRTVNVVDRIAPVVTAPGPVTAEATGSTTPVALGTATATDNVGVTSITHDAPAGFPLGDTAVTWTATDAEGNQGTATQRVTVRDTTPPTLTLLGANPFQHVAGTTFDDPGAAAADLADSDLAVVVGGDAIDSATAPGSYTLTYDVSDASGNAATQVTRTVVVVPAVDGDVTPPAVVATTPGGIYLNQITVALVADEPATIYYTTDGTQPTEASTRYRDPLVVQNTLVLKFFGVDRAGNPSEVDEVRYTITAASSGGGGGGGGCFLQTLGSGWR